MMPNLVGTRDKDMVAAMKDMSGEWRAFMGIPQTDSVQVLQSLSSYATAPADEAWVYSCVSRRASFAQSVPLRVYVKDGQDRIAAELSTNQAAKDYQFLLNNCNDTMTGSDLMAYTEAAMCVWGRAWWKKVRGRLGGPPQEVWFLRAPDMRVTKGPAGRILGVTWQDSTVGAAPEDYPYKDMIYFRSWNLQDSTEGLSPLSPIRYAVSVNRQASMSTSSLLANWGIPPLAWVAPKGAEITRQDQSLLRRFMAQFRGAGNTGKTALLPEGLEPKIISLSPKDADWIQARKVSRMEICAALHVPLPLAGDDDKSSVYANLRDAERIFARFMIGELDRTADFLNNWLTPDFDKSRQLIEVAFDYSEIEALQPPMDLMWNMWLAAEDRLNLTPNEFRAKFRIGPKVDWGNDPVPHTQMRLTGLADPMLPGVAPFTPAPAPQEPQVVAPEVTDEPTESASLRSIERLYAQPAVKMFLETGVLSTESLLGHEVDASIRAHIATGLTRRYSAAQIVDGVPAEHYPPLSEV